MSGGSEHDGIRLASGAGTYADLPQAGNSKNALRLGGYRPAPGRVIYFIRAAVVPSMVKIGCTRWLDRRLETLRSNSPVPLILLASIPGDHKLEWRIHADLDPYRSHGEWFFEDAVVRAYMAGLAGCSHA